jgi:hypothetical protein
MKRCNICGRYGDSHLHGLRRLLKMLGVRAILKIQREKKKEIKPIIQEPVETLPLFSEDKNV